MRACLRQGSTEIFLTQVSGNHNVRVLLCVTESSRTTQALVLLIGPLSNTSLTELPIRISNPAVEVDTYQEDPVAVVQP